MNPSSGSGSTSRKSFTDVFGTASRKPGNSIWGTVSLDLPSGGPEICGSNDSTNSKHMLQELDGIGFKL